MKTATDPWTLSSQEKDSQFKLEIPTLKEGWYWLIA
jgi:hypothetical protein